jgi:membrane-associated phospholipid phosphatase
MYLLPMPRLDRRSRAAQRSMSRLFVQSASLIVFAAGSALTQVAGTAGAHTDSAAAQPLFTVRDALIAGAFVGATVIALPLDKRIAHHLENQGAQSNTFFHHAATGLEEFTSPGAYYIGGGLYLIGRLGSFGRLADLGLHGTEAVLVGDAVTGLLKGVVGRSRPFVTLDTNPHDFHFGRGFSNDNYTSFPSGHTTTAFAAAAAVTGETGRWFPRSTWIVGPVMYTGASLVGLSRMYHNKHWASDVALGAAIGTFSGQKVSQFNHEHPHNKIDRLLLATSIAPNGTGGAMLSWSMQVP